jgi:hypothetical protein
LEAGLKNPKLSEYELHFYARFDPVFDPLRAAICALKSCCVTRCRRAQSLSINQRASDR